MQPRIKMETGKKKAKASAHLDDSGDVLRHNNAQKIRKKQSKRKLEKNAKRKAEKQQANARRHFLRTTNNLHALTKGHQDRLAARRWVQVQLDAKSITGHTANELWHFLKDRELGGFNRGTIEKEDLSDEAMSAWVRYLKELTIPAGVRVDVNDVFAAGDIGEEASDAMGAGEEDARVMLSPEPPAMDDEAATEGEDDEDGGLMLGPLAFRPKQKEM